MAISNTRTNRQAVLVLTSSFPRWEKDPGPAFVLELSRRLTTDFEITVLAPRAPRSKKHETIEDLRVIRFPYFLQRGETLAMHGGGILNNLKNNPLVYLLVPFFFAGQLLALVRLLCRERFDLIHAHWLIPQGFVAVLSRLLARKNQISVICTSHGSDLFSLRGLLLNRLKRWVIYRSQALTVVSSPMKETVIGMGVKPEKVQVISMGVDLAHHYRPDSSTVRDSDSLLFVGRLVEGKGVEILLEALPEVLKKRIYTRLTVAGSGPLENKLKEQTRILGIEEKVAFLGMVPQSRLPELYRRATLAVFPFVITRTGTQEGFGLVVVEAMGCCCPVIAGDLPAIHDTIEHEKNGILVPPDNPRALARAIIRMINDPGLRDRLAQEGRKRVTENFDWEIVAERYGGVYGQLIRNLRKDNLSQQH